MTEPFLTYFLPLFLSFLPSLTTFFFLFFSPAFQLVSHFLCIKLCFLLSLGVQINMVSALRVRRKNKQPVLSIYHRSIS